MLIKRFFNNNATGQPKEEGSNAPLNPVLSCIIKTVGFRRIPCQRSLATSVDVDRTILRNSRPMLFSESGRRHDRVWVEIRSHLGGDTVASGRRYDRVWEEKRSHLGRETVASGTVFANKYRIWFIGVVAPCFTRCCYVACAMWWIYIDVALTFGTEIHPLKTSKAIMIFYCV